MKRNFLKITLFGMLIICSLVVAANKERKKITAIKAKQIALAKVPGATFANVLEFDSENANLYKGQISYRGVAYNFEIDVYTGKIINWSEENK